MTHFDEIFASPEWAFTFAAALEQQLGDDRILTVGSPRERVSEILRDEPARAVALNFTTGDGQAGSVALIAVTSFTEALERAASDEILLTACVTALEAAVRSIGEQAVTELETEAGHETEAELVGDDRNDGHHDGEMVVYPLLDGGEVLGCLILRISSNANGAPAASGHSAFPGDETTSSTNAAGASYVLADVEMGVTAELGRCRMTVRELLSITPGAVIDLDRAAGAPVDVLVNGTLIARGEVVVIDEEFGIRISELIPQPAAAR
jgi:flagellar motor switch protein FliN/FliY